MFVSLKLHRRLHLNTSSFMGLNPTIRVPVRPRIEQKKVYGDDDLCLIPMRLDKIKQ